MALYVYVLSVVLNIMAIYKKFKGRNCFLPFLILKILFLVFLFNILFEGFKRWFGSGVIDEGSLIFVYCVGGILYLLKKRYICLSLSFLISYIISFIFSIPINIQDIVFIIGFTHLCEGIFMLLCKEVRGSMYLPLFLHEYALIFFLFYNRKERGIKYSNVISGIFVLGYGIFILILYRKLPSFMMVIFTYVFHEIMMFLENMILNKVMYDFTK